MSSELRAAHASRTDGGGLTEATVDQACAMVSDTTNGVSAIKIERTGLDGQLQRLVRAVADRPDVRLVLKGSKLSGRPTKRRADAVAATAMRELP
jgi:hypothetical protein